MYKHLQVLFYIQNMFELKYHFIYFTSKITRKLKIFQKLYTLKKLLKHTFNKKKNS